MQVGGGKITIVPRRIPTPFLSIDQYHSNGEQNHIGERYSNKKQVTTYRQNWAGPVRATWWGSDMHLEVEVYSSCVRFRTVE